MSCILQKDCAPLIDIGMYARHCSWQVCFSSFYHRQVMSTVLANRTSSREGTSISKCACTRTLAKCRSRLSASYHTFIARAYVCLPFLCQSGKQNEPHGFERMKQNARRWYWKVTEQCTCLIASLGSRMSPYI